MRARAVVIGILAACVALAGHAAAPARANPEPPPAIDPEQQSGMERSKIGEQQAVVLVYFALGSAQLDADAKATLEQALLRLSRGSDPITIGGHTDGVGEAKYNQKLSEQRAAAVREYLVMHGIGAERMTTVGYGKSQPVDSNDSEDGRRHNRRAVLKIGAPP